MSEIRSKEWLDKGRELRELAALSDTIWRTETTDFGGYSARDAHAVADHLWAEGYRKPRTVNSVEELEALPPGSVIKLPDGEVGMIMVARDKRHVVGYPQCLPTSELAEVVRSTYGDPIRVLFTPGDAG